jgi:alkylation response protein AidB-like acyl-CoA dehydrogenase
MGEVQPDAGCYLESARALAARVAAETDRIDRERVIPSELAGEIADKGFFRLLVPRSLGGAGLDYLGYLRIVQVFGEVDGSTARCINQNNVFATNSVRMPEQTAQEIWGDRRAVVTNGPPNFVGQSRSRRRWLSAHRAMEFQHWHPPCDLG